MSKHKLQFHWLAEVYHKAESLVSASFFIFLSLLPRVFLLCWLVLLCHPFFLSFLPLSRSVLEKAVTLPVSVAERITLSLSLSLRLSLSDSNSTPLHTNAPTHTHTNIGYMALCKCRQTYCRGKTETVVFCIEPTFCQFTSLSGKDSKWSANCWYNQKLSFVVNSNIKCCDDDQ